MAKSTYQAVFNNIVSKTVVRKEEGKVVSLILSIL